MAAWTACTKTAHSEQWTVHSEQWTVDGGQFFPLGAGDLDTQELQKASSFGWGSFVGAQLLFIGINGIPITTRYSNDY